jgi:peroxiredoxin
MLALAVLTAFSLADTAGKTHSQAELSGQKATVFVFTSTECPITNTSVPELNRIAAAYQGRGVAFLAVQSDPTQSAEAVRQYAADFKIAFPVLLDAKLTLAKTLGATVTPEAAVIDSKGNLLYLGRIDNRVEDFGRKRNAATEHDLTDALDAVLAGKSVAKERTKAVGCSIPFILADATNRAPTYAHDVAPILYANCASCHRPGEVAPFSLLNYADARKRADQIAYVTSTRYMPPWKAEPGYGHFLDERRLSAGEIEILSRWAKAGAPEGDPKEAPPTPQFTPDWQGGEPALAVKMPQSFRLAASGPDRFQCFVIPVDVPEDRYVTQMEFRPGNPRIVHHSILFLDDQGRGRARDEATPEPGYPCLGGPGFLAAGLGGWAPGASPTRFPDGAARPLKKGADIVVQIHYHPSGKEETDISSIGLTFGPQPVLGFVSAVVGTTKFDIPAGEANYRVKSSLTMPMAGVAVGITPHAHYLAKDMKVTAYLPGGETKPLIWIKDWDFNWQGQYVFEEPVLLPQGARIELDYTYDNSAANPHNPSSPPRRVQFGEETTDEMAFAFVQIVLPKPGDQMPFQISMALELMSQGVIDGFRDAQRRQRRRQAP